MSADPVAGPAADDRRSGPGLALLLITSLAIGALSAVPFAVAGYVLSQWALVPLGMADRDATFNDGFVPALVTGIVAPVLLLTCWLLVTHRISRWAALNRIAAWSTATLGLLAPTIALVVHRT